MKKAEENDKTDESKKNKDNEGGESEKKKSNGDKSEKRDSWGIDTSVLRPVQRRPVKLKPAKITLENPEFPLEDLVEIDGGDLESEVGGSTSLEGEPVDYATSGNSTSELAERDAGGMRKAPEQMYSSNTSDQAYGNLQSDRAVGQVGVVYDSANKFNPTERSWSTDTHWKPSDISDVRTVDGSRPVDPRDMIEGQTFAGTEAQDGFASAAKKGKYEARS